MAVRVTRRVIGQWIASAIRAGSAAMGGPLVSQRAIGGLTGFVVDAIGNLLGPPPYKLSVSSARGVDADMFGIRNKPLPEVTGGRPAAGFGFRWGRRDRQPCDSMTISR